MHTLGLLLQSQVTFSPGATEAMIMSTLNLHFEEEEPTGILSGLSALPCHHHGLLILLTPLPVPEPICFIKSAAAVLQYEHKILELV